MSAGAEHMLLLCIASFRPGELNEDGEGEVRPNEMTNGLAFLLSHQTQGALMRVRGEARGTMCPTGARGEKGEKTNRTLISLSHRARAPTGDSTETQVLPSTTTQPHTHSLSHTHTKGAPLQLYGSSV